MAGRGLARSRAVLGAVLLAVAAGCDSDRDVAVSGPTRVEGIVLERVELEQGSHDFVPRCVVEGGIRNETGRDQRLTLVFHAFSGDGSHIATAVAEVDYVAAGRGASFGASLRNLSDDGFLNDCDRVARVELVDVLF